MLKNLRQALRTNPRFGSPVNRDYMRNLLKELEPHHGLLRLIQDPGVAVAVSTTPAQVTIFDESLNYNDQILADDTTDNITIQNTQGVYPQGWFEQFAAGVTGHGLMAEIRIDATFTAPSSQIVNIEVYVDGSPSGIVAVFPTESGFQEARVIRKLHIPDGAVLTFYVYCNSGSFNATFTEFNIDLEKIPLGVDSDAVTAFAEV